MSKITLFANGKARQAEQDCKLTTLIEELGLEPRTLLIEHNGNALLREEWPQITLEHGDRIELFRVSAGG